MSIALIAAISKNNCIGRDNDLPWHIPEDLEFFKKMTQDKVVLMGRKTWESIPEKYRPLPKRTNVIISRNTEYSVPKGVYVFADVEQALNYFEGQEIMVSGGGQIYALVMDKADTLYITHVDQEIPECHAFFPHIDPKIWLKAERIDRDGYSFVTYKKV